MDVTASVSYGAGHRDRAAANGNQDNGHRGRVAANGKRDNGYHDKGARSNSNGDNDYQDNSGGHRVGVPLVKGLDLFDDLDCIVDKV